MANSLVHGRGLDVNYVSFFFIPYGREITRREDHWPPFLSFTIAPFLAIFGNEPRTARIAPILIGSFGLPLMAAWLGIRYSRRTYVGLLAGLCMLANSAMFQDSMRTMSDVATAMLVTGFCAALLATRDRPRAHVACGLFAAAAFYSKGSLLLLLALYPALVVVIGGSRAIRSRWFHAGLAAAILCVSPWLISNYRLFGNPFHSTQNYVSSFFGVEALDPSLYKPYWGRDLPKIGDRWKGDPAKLKRRLAMNREQMVRWSVLGPGTSEKAWTEMGPAGVAGYYFLIGAPDRGGGLKPNPKPITRWEEPVTSFCGITAILFSVFLVLGGIVSIVSRLRPGHRRSRDGDERIDAPVGFALPPTLPPRSAPPLAQDARRESGGPLLRPTMALLLVMLTHGVFLVFLWKAIPRFSYPFLPLLAVIGITGAGRLIEWPLRSLRPRWDPRRDGWVTTALAIAVLAVLVVDGKGLKSLTAARKRTDSAVIERPTFREPYAEIGRWIGLNLPDAVIMARNPWELLYYAGPRNKAVAMPFSSPEDLFSIARYYRVTHYLSDAERPGMEAFLGGNHPGMQRVVGAPGRLFKLDYAWLPDSGLSGAAAP